MSKLQTPLKLRSGIELKNRIVMAPMTTEAATASGRVTQKMLDYYQSRAGEPSAIIVECAYVERLGMAYPNGVGLESDSQIADLAKIAKVIQDKGSKAILQVYHGGRMVLPGIIGSQQPVGPSPVVAERLGYVEPRELSSEEIQNLITQFSEITRRAIQAGFDGVEIHGANTYLIQQFFSPHSNRRSDQWGGSREKRATFPLAVVDAVKAAATKYASGKPFAVGYRFSPEELEKPGITFDDTLFLLEKLAEKDLDYLHFSTSYVMQSSIIDIADKEPLIAKLLARRSAKLAQIPLIGVGNVKQIADAEHGLENGFDLIAVGKSMIVNEHWLSRGLAGEELETFMRKEDCAPRHVPESIWPIITDCMARHERAFINRNTPRKDFAEGVYRESFADFHGMVNVDITLDKVSIQKLDFLTGTSGAPGVTVDAFAEMADRIVKSNSTDVDIVSGATETCQSLLEAVNRVVAKATGAELPKKPSKNASLPWAGADPEIHPDDVVAEIETDVIVVGCGVAGTVATRSAAEEGADVVVIEKAAGPQCRSGEYAVINGKVQARWGRDVYDPDQITDRFVRECAYRNKRPIVAKWAHNCADVFDWFIAAKPDMHICETSSSDVPDESKDLFLEPLYYPLPPHYDWTKEPFPTIPTSVHFMPDQTGIIIANMDKAMDTGKVTAYWGHFVEKLIKDGNRVTGVFTRDAKTGKYIKVSARKGVILATGEYGSNREIVDYYVPEISENGVKSVWLNRDVEGNLTNTGDGLKMGARIGAAIQQHHAPMTHHMGGPFGMGGALGIAPFLFLNRDGKRFMNEDVPGQQVENQLEMQPERRCYQIFDSRWREQVEFMPAGHGVVCAYDSGSEYEGKNHPRYSLSYRSEAEFEAELANGNMFKADTLEELLAKLNIDQSEAAKSIARYNELVAQKRDADFNKTPSRLFPIIEGPFYAVPFGLTVMLACCGGLESDEDCHTYDEDRRIIPGLYVAGNIQGNRYAVEYPICMKGVSHSMCMYYGYVAGKNAVHGK